MPGTDGEGEAQEELELLGASARELSSLCYVPAEGAAEGGAQAGLQQMLDAIGEMGAQLREQNEALQAHNQLLREILDPGSCCCGTI